MFQAQLLPPLDQAIDSQRKVKAKNIKNAKNTACSSALPYVKTRP
jgi:hypothetical protein